MKQFSDNRQSQFGERNPHFSKERVLLPKLVDKRGQSIKNNQASNLKDLTS